MKKVFQHINIAVTLAAVMSVLNACTYKGFMEDDILQEDKQLVITYDWSRVEEIPPSMCVMFYSLNETDTGRTVQEFMTGNTETVISIPAGHYAVTTWNSNIEYAFTKNENSREGVYATTGTYSSHGNTGMEKVIDSLYNHQTVLDYPDYMVHGNNKGFVVEVERNYQNITLRMDSMVVRIDVKLTGIKGLEWCKKVRGTIGNIAGKRYISYDNVTEELVTVIFDGEVNLEDSTVTAQFYVFGIEPTQDTGLEHKMTLFYWLEGGQVFVPIDVTAAFREASLLDKKMEIVIPQDDLDLREYAKGAGTGIIVDADDWESTEDVPIDF